MVWYGMATTPKPNAETLLLYFTLPLLIVPCSCRVVSSSPIPKLKMPAFLHCMFFFFFVCIFLFGGRGEEWGGYHGEGWEDKTQLSTPTLPLILMLIVDR